MFARVFIASLVAAVVTGLMLGGVSLWRSVSFSNEATQAIIRENTAALDNQIQGMHTAMNTLDQALSVQLDGNMAVAATQLQAAGGFRLLPGTTQWTATNQDTKEQSVASLPAMAIGDYLLNPSSAAADFLPAVDTTQKLVGGAVTVFQRMNPQGDMLRVATNVKKDDGSRAFGTYIAAKKKNGENNKIIETVLQGKDYKGTALVVGQWYVVKYSPIVINGNVEGVLFVGLRQDDIAAVRSAIEEQKFGKNGFAGLLTASSANAGTLRLGGNADYVGKNLWEQKDADGKTFVQETIEKSKAAPGKVVSVKFRDASLGEGTMKGLYFEPWDVVITAFVYDSDFAQTITAVQQVKNSTLFMMVWILAALLLALVVVAFLATAISRSIVKPLISLKNQVNDMISGVIDLRKPLTVEAGGEIGVLTESVNAFATRVKEAVDEIGVNIGEVQQVCAAMTKNANQLEASSTKFSEEVTQVEGSTESILESVNQSVNATSELNAAISEIASAASKASDVALNAEQLSKSANETIETLNTASQDIGNVISLISGIAEQTNLLALNATIESARAGEAGKGFAVVAGEVKDLAGQTGSATEESSDQIERIQAQAQTVSEAMSEIDEVISKINEYQTSIAASVEEQSATTTTVQQGVQNIETAIASIAQSLQNVTAASQENLQVAENTKSSATQLQNVSDDLAKQLQTFVVE